LSKLLLRGVEVAEAEALAVGVPRLELRRKVSV
jgi:hypothetical protein